MVDDETRDCDCWAHKQMDAPTVERCGCEESVALRAALERIATAEPFKGDEAGYREWVRIIARRALSGGA